MTTHALKLADAQGHEEDAVVETSGGPPYELALTAPSFGTIRFTADDLIACLRQLRERIEPAGWRLLCNGARRDANASGMQRDMFGGDVVYVLRPGVEASQADVVPTFGPAPARAIGTLQEQDAFHARWLQSLRRKGAGSQGSLAMPRRSPSFSLGRARGCLLGLAVGDALGSTTEFAKLQAPPFPRLAAGPHRTMSGGGPFGLAPGQVTDDTQMAVCLADSLSARRALDIDDIRKGYRRWASTAFDIGHQTSGVLAVDAASGTDALRASRDYWVRHGRTPAGNGSLMRTAPIGVAFHSDTARATEASLAESAITHFDPRCRLACAAFNESLARAVGGREPPSPRDLAEAAHGSLSAALVLLLRETEDADDETAIKSARDELAEDLAWARKDDPQLYGDLHLHKTQGFVRVAFRLAYWELWHAPSFEEALVDVVNRGGDADTNGAITGALLGACYGEDAIPKEWSEAVIGASGSDEYVPERLLRLVEVVAESTA
jgi:ADP-ribosylglycohydrolase